MLLRVSFPGSACFNQMTIQLNRLVCDCCPAELLFYASAPSFAEFSASIRIVQQGGELGGQIAAQTCSGFVGKLVTGSCSNGTR